MPRRICVVVTARPSYARIRSAMRAIAAHPELELQLVVTASALQDDGDPPDRVMESEGFRIDRRVASFDASGGLASMVRTTAAGMNGLAGVLPELRPDAVLTIADRYETIATAVASAYLNIPLVHVQGGEVTGSIDEKVRHAITKLADLHLVASVEAADRVRHMGEDPARIIVTGCPSIDVAREALLHPDSPADFLRRHAAVGDTVDLAGRFLIVLQHPVTTEFGHAGEQVIETLHAIRRFGCPALWFWPNVDAGADTVSAAIRTFRAEHGLPGIAFLANVPPEDFIRLLHRAQMIVGNSSVGIRECAWMGVPTVNVGTRQQGRDRGVNVVDVPHQRDSILAAMSLQAEAGRFPADLRYGTGHAGERIAEALSVAPLGIEKRLPW